MMNRILLPLFLFISPLFLHAQNIDSVAIEQKCARHLEIGINGTLLLKQVFDLSNNTFPMLPYDVTFKLISERSAWRLGLGGTIDNTTTTRNQTNVSGVNGLDPAVPIYSNSYMLFARAGWEMRFPIEKRLLLSAGIDLAIQNGSSKSQTYYETNNLPNYYYYSKSNTSSTTSYFGGGPEIGIQFRLSQHFSLSTEAPLYFMYRNLSSSATDYTDYYDGFNSTKHTVEDKSTDTGIKGSLTLPVTLYCSFEF